MSRRFYPIKAHLKRRLKELLEVKQWVLDRNPTRQARQEALGAMIQWHRATYHASGFYRRLRGASNGGIRRRELLSRERQLEIARNATAASPLGHPKHDSQSVSA